MPRSKRDEKIERYYNNSLHRKLLEVMEILEPGNNLHWGAKRQADLVGYATIHLALEYCALTGVPPEKLLDPSRDVDDPTPSTDDIKHMYATEEALPL